MSLSSVSTRENLTSRSSHLCTLRSRTQSPPHSRTTPKEFGTYICMYEFVPPRSYRQKSVESPYYTPKRFNHESTHPKKYADRVYVARRITSLLYGHPRAPTVNIQDNTVQEHNVRREDVKVYRTWIPCFVEIFQSEGDLDTVRVSCQKFVRHMDQLQAMESALGNVEVVIADFSSNGCVDRR